jgi:tRNA nucleotidyltransferase/poly(A) polymerase
MGVRENLLRIKSIAKENGLSTPYIVGGLPRDKVLNTPFNVADIDLATGDESVHILAQIISKEFGVESLRLPDGHYQVHIGGVKYDFSSNYISPRAKYFLSRSGIHHPTSLQLEMFSRDFTCNTLLCTLDLRKIMDPLGMGLPDMKAKILRTPLPSRITLREDPKRAIRAIYLAAKLGFDVEEDVVDWCRNNVEYVKASVSKGFIKKKLTSSYKYDPDKTVQLISSFDFTSLDLPNVVRGI